MSITVNVGQILLPLSSTCSELRGATSTWENSWDTYTVGETIIGLSSQNSEVDARKERGSISLLTHNIDPVSIYNYYIIFNITHKLVIILLIVLALVCISAYTVMWESPNLSLTPLCLRLMVFTLSEAFLQTIRHPYSCVRHIKGFISILYQKVKRWQFISKGYRPTWPVMRDFWPGVKIELSC